MTRLTLRVYQVVANAAIGGDFGSVVDIKLETLQEHIETNVYGSSLPFKFAVVSLS
jgi:NAD(P)-dependent dehydrogenase (short-subunit alcohol dehydrogenase family)